MQGVVFGLALDGVGLGDACGAGFGQGGVQLVQDVLAQHMVIELCGSLAVERFLPCAIGQDGMVQAGGRQHGTFGQPKYGWRSTVSGV